MSEEWRTGLCGCCDDMGICCYGWFCSVCLWSEMKTKVDQTSCCCNCILLSICMPCLGCTYRSNYRAKFGIDGGCCGDFCASLYCFPLAGCQMARDFKIREQEDADRASRAANTQQIAVVQMPMMMSPGMAPAPGMVMMAPGMGGPPQYVTSQPVMMVSAQPVVYRG